MQNIYIEGQSIKEVAVIFKEIWYRHEKSDDPDVILVVE